MRTSVLLTIFIVSLITLVTGCGNGDTSSSATLVVEGCQGCHTHKQGQPTTKCKAPKKGGGGRERSVTELSTQPLPLTPSGPTDPVDSPSQPVPANVAICHKPGTPAERDLSVPVSAVPGHLGHGDTEGSCQ